MKSTDVLITDVLISGGGVPGLTLGIMLAQAGLKVIVCDPTPPLLTKNIPLSGRTIALMEGSLGLLAQAGILEKVESVSQNLLTLSVVDDEFSAHFHAHEIGMKRFGQNIQINQMQAHATDIFLKTKNATLLQETVESFQTSNNNIIATLSSGETIQASLLIGADGRHSKVRTGANIDVWEHDYQQIALTGVIDHSLPHQSASTEFHYAGGPFTLVPMQGHMSSFVWMEKKDDALRIARLPKEDIEKIMLEKSLGLVGQISLKMDIVSHPIKVQKAKKLIAPRVALMAEAAHVISPIGAQGLNLSLRDVAALYDSILSGARLGLDIGSPQILETYEKSRLGDIVLRVAGTDALNRSVATHNSLLNNLRRLGFKAATNIAPLKSILMHEALAPSHSLFHDMLPDLDTRATVKTSTRAAPAA